MSDEFYSMMDWFGTRYFHIGAELENVDEYNRPTFSVEFEIGMYLKSKKLGRKMRALYLFIDNNRKIASEVKDRVVPQRDLDRNWIYKINEDFDYLIDDIDSYARSSTHAKQIKSQLAELRSMIEAEVESAGHSIADFRREQSNQPEMA